ncbi:MAG: DNA repair protein RadA, partial [Thermacetogeniaceae bacterium]
VDQDTVALGEVGLTGEVRGVSSMEQRLKEVVRLGFKRVLVPVSSMELQARYQSIEIKGVRTVQDALDHAI